MEDSFAKALQSLYGLKVISSAKSRGNLICKTDRGVKELKKTLADEKRLLFEHDAKEHLYSHGFEALDRYIETLDKTPFCIIDGSRYVLTDFKPSQSLDLGEKTGLLRGAEQMAVMHNAAWGLYSRAEPLTFGQLAQVYERRSKELSKIKKRIEKTPRLSSIDIMVLDNFDYYRERSDDAVSMLKSSGYMKLAADAGERRTFCHNSYKGENIRVRDGTEDIFITGFTRCAYDCHVTDLAEYLRRYLKSPDADIRTLLDVIKAYDKIKTVTKTEMDVMLAMLTYPYKFMKLVNEYYNKRQVYISGAQKDRFERCIAQRTYEPGILKELNRV